MTFERVYTYITNLCPQLAAKNTFIIQEWLTKYDTEKDIIPAIDIATKRGTNSIYSFNFFTAQIQKKNEARIKEQAQPKELPNPEKDARKAEKIRWLIEKNIASTALSQSDIEWFNKYEETHNRLADA